MDTNLKQAVLKASITSMVAELDARIGDDNPFHDLDLSQATVEDLSAVKRSLHEILYAPPPSRT